MIFPDLSAKKVVKEYERYVEIYKITCLETEKIYIGQAVSHILNHGKFHRYGMEKRFAYHVSEAFSTKKNQCHYLNNAIRKYGPDRFAIELIETCSLSEADEREAKYIVEMNSMFPHGYNLKLGTATTRLSLEGRKRVSKGVRAYFQDKKLARFAGISVPAKDPSSFIHVLRRNGKQYGWYVLISGKKADFGGVHITLEESRHMAEDFIETLCAKYKMSVMATHLDAGTP